MALLYHNLRRSAKCPPVKNFIGFRKRLRCKNTTECTKNKRKIIDYIAKTLDFILEPDDIEKLITALSDVFIKTDNKEGKSDFLNILRQYTTEEILYRQGGILSVFHSRINARYKDTGQKLEQTQSQQF